MDHDAHASRQDRGDRPGNPRGTCRRPKGNRSAKRSEMPPVIRFLETPWGIDLCPSFRLHLETLLPSAGLFHAKFRFALTNSRHLSGLPFWAIVPLMDTHRCPQCNALVIDRRFPFCTTCHAALPEEWVMTPEQVAKVQHDRRPRPRRTRHGHGEARTSQDSSDRCHHSPRSMPGFVTTPPPALRSRGLPRRGGSNNSTTASCPGCIRARR